MAADNSLKLLKSHLTCTSSPYVHSTVDEITKAPCVKFKDGKTITGISAIVQHFYRLVEKDRNKTEVISFEEWLDIIQWLEYRTNYIDRFSTEVEANFILKELNAKLKDRVFLVGSHLSLADLLLYEGLHKVMSQLSFHDKEKWNHVSRWFNLIQNSIPRIYPVIIFSRTPLYNINN